jgi:hypothetical protein
MKDNPNPIPPLSKEQIARMKAIKLQSMNIVINEAKAKAMAKAQDKKIKS